MIAKITLFLFLSLTLTTTSCLAQKSENQQNDLEPKSFELMRSQEIDIQINCGGYKPKEEAFEDQIDAPTHLLLIDPLDRKVGYNPSAPPYGWAMWDHYHEMPNSAYEPEGGLPADPNDPHNRPPVVRELKIGKSTVGGTYILEVVGAEKGKYYLSAGVALSHIGMGSSKVERLLEQMYFGFSHPNKKDIYLLTYDPYTKTQATFVKDVTFKTISKDLKVAHELKLITDKKLYRSLLTKAKKLSKSKGKKREEFFKAFISELDSNKDKKILGKAYDILKEDAESLHKLQ
ncbi:hypothetical protein ACFL6Y_11190 [Elusimicrobiota bacterium]